MRQCFIHVGTHKTGTTSIQRMLAEHVHQLAGKGYIYPVAGRLFDHPGHHNLAWQISGDRRFTAQAGTLDDLLDEVANKAGHILLSSEDFECALHHPEGFKKFVGRLQSLGLRVTVILYVRRQIDYLPRIYLTLVAHFGFDQPFERVLAEVLADGRFSWQDWTFSFDYLDLTRRIERFEGVKLIVRSYDVAANAICADMLSVLGMTLSALDYDQEIVANVSLPISDSFMAFLKTRLGRNPSDDELAVAASMVGKVDTATLSSEARRKLSARFEYSNQAVSLKYGLPDFDLIRDPEENGAFGIDTLFSEKNQRSLFPSPA